MVVTDFTRLYIGMIVHYVDHDRAFASDKGVHQAAIVTGLPDRSNGCIHLTVFPATTHPSGASDRWIAYGKMNVAYSSTWEPGTWHFVDDDRGG